MMKPDKLQIILNEVFGGQTQKPNKFTIGMGELIREAREELGWSQAELAVKVDMRRATLSNIEHGKSEPSATQLLYISVTLEKPVMHFFPKYARDYLEEDDLSPLEIELVRSFRYLSNDKIRKIVLKQVQVMDEFRPVDILLDSFDFAKEEFEVKQEFEDQRNIKKNSL